MRISHCSSNSGLHPYVKYNFEGSLEVQELVKKVKDVGKTKELMTPEEWDEFCKKRNININSKIMIENIENTIEDLVSDFLYYDRKEDEDLPRGAIQKAVKDGLITKEQIIKKFAESLNEGLSE